MLCSLSVCAPGCVVCCLYSFFSRCWHRQPLWWRQSSHHVSSTTSSTPVSCSHSPLHHSSRCLDPFSPSLLTAPFTSNLDAPSGCLGGMCSLPPPHSHWPVPSIFKLFPSFLMFPSSHLSRRAACLFHAHTVRPTTLRAVWIWSPSPHGTLHEHL
jgi:hypothetical protein